jgi:hypothetical protein
MKTISLKLDDNIFNVTEGLLATVNLSRNRYINEALLYYNRLQYKRQLAKTLESESKACEKSSKEVLKEFEMIDDAHFAGRRPVIARHEAIQKNRYEWFY